MPSRKKTNPTRSVSLRTRVCHSNTRIVVRLLGPCFKTGRLRPFRRREPCGPTCLFLDAVSPRDYKAAARRQSHLSHGLLQHRKRAPTCCKLKHHPQREGSRTRSITGLNRFPFNNFTYYLTLFSKFFSSFPHGTCSLSVSCQYLALDEMYHPFWTAFPNNPTLGASFIRTSQMTQTGMSPSLLSLSRELWPSRSPKGDPLNYNSDAQRTPDFKFELFPLHSPLLGESLLVSFPPLTDMLKFSGYPYLI